jgi:hypothetical protein
MQALVVAVAFWQLEVEGKWHSVVLYFQDGFLYIKDKVKEK